MAYTVSFGTTDKRVNSTSRIYVVKHSGVSCVLKVESSISHPVFTYQGAFDASCNYFYVSEWTGYYWITEAKFYGGHWTISGERDALATYKDAIGSTSMYVLRSSAAFTSNIADSMAAQEAYCSTSSTSYAMGFDTTGHYILCCAGENGSQFIQVSNQHFQEMYQDVFSAGLYTSIWAIMKDIYNGESTAIADKMQLSLTNTFFDPSQYVSSAIWVPFPYPSGALGGRVKLGFVNGPTGHPLGAGELIYSNTIAFTIAHNPDELTVGQWVTSNAAQVTTVSIPGIGDINIDMSSRPSTGTITLACDVDGVLYARINCGGRQYLRSGKIGVDVGLNKITTNATGALAGIGQIGVAAVTGNPAMAAGGVASIGTSLIPKVESLTSGGSRAIGAVSPNVIVTTQWPHIHSDYNAVLGRPYCVTTTPSAIPGYILAQGASVAGAYGSTADEKDKINSYLNSGFFYE